MPKGKNMDCVHKWVYNMWLEFEEKPNRQKENTRNTHKKQ